MNNSKKVELFEEQFDDIGTFRDGTIRGKWNYSSEQFEDIGTIREEQFEKIGTIRVNNSRILEQFEPLHRQTPEIGQTSPLSVELFPLERSNCSRPLKKGIFSKF